MHLDFLDAANGHKMNGCGVVTSVSVCQGKGGIFLLAYFTNQIAFPVHPR